jgi:hypothetical protein
MALLRPAPTVVSPTRFLFFSLCICIKKASFLELVTGGVEKNREA